MQKKEFYLSSETFKRISMNSTNEDLRNKIHGWFLDCENLVSLYLEYEVVYKLKKIYIEINSDLNKKLQKNKTFKDSYFDQSKNIKKHGYVYILTNFSLMKQNLYKIGCTNDLAARVSNMSPSIDPLLILYWSFWTILLLHLIVHHL